MKEAIIMEKNKLLKLDINEKSKEDFLLYANAVIKSRAISRVEDNLKPVHRRILYGMGHELGLNSTKKTKKSAKVVGAVMGSFHPHGDSSIYNAMVRLAQPWKMRYPLVEIQGNMGNQLGDGPAASRYTEAKLSVFGDLMLEGIKKKGVAFKPNYDDSTIEPVVLPSVFPNLLCNGNAGIAVGFSSSLVPHNLKEAVAAIIAYLDFKAIGVEGLMKHLPGPDFPTGGTIIDSDKIKDIYKTGQGTLTLRSKYTIEENRGQTSIVITEIPYLVDVEAIIESIRKLILEENFDLIEDVENNTGKDGLNLRIVLKKGANLYKVLDVLWAKTRLQTTQRVANTVIVAGKPLVLGLKELIMEYVTHRHNVIVNIALFELEKVEERMLIVEALLKALAQIDPIIKMIKESDNKGAARIKIMDFLKISEVQANAILDMKLSRLSKLDGVELAAELKDLQEQKKSLNELINSPQKRELQMKRELLQISAKYGDSRRTTLSVVDQMAALDSASEPINILMMEDGGVFATQQDLKALTAARKNSPLGGVAIRAAISTTTDKIIGVFTADGTLNHINPLMLSRETLEKGLLPAMPLAAFEMGSESDLPPYTIFCSSDGLIKRTLTSEFVKAKNGSRTTKLRSGQTVLFVGFANESDHVAVLSEKLNYFPINSIPVQSKLTLGSKAIAKGDVLSVAVVAPNSKLLMINNSGQAKLVDTQELVVGIRGGVGQVVADGSTAISTAGEAYIIYDTKNHLITKNPTTKTKTAAGAKLINGSPRSIVVLK